MNELLGFASTFAWILARPHDNQFFFFQVSDQLFNAPVVLRILDVDILVVEDFWELLPYERDLETPLMGSHQRMELPLGQGVSREGDLLLVKVIARHGGGDSRPSMQ